MAIAEPFEQLGETFDERQEPHLEAADELHGDQGTALDDTEDSLAVEDKALRDVAGDTS